MTSPSTAWLAGLLGLALVGLIAAALGLPAGDSLALVGIAGGAGMVTGALGAGALWLLRGRSFSAQVSVVALTSTAAVTVGALAAGNAMFLNSHDLQALLIIVASGAVVGIVAALLLGRRVGAASRSLGEAARRLGMPEEGPSGVLAATGGMPEQLIREFAGLAEQLEHTRAELAESRARERAIDRARRELVSWVSHDLRTPLAGIRAITELLEDGLVEDPEEIRSYYATLGREADKLSELVGDLFQVSTIEAGAVALDYGDINLGDLVSDTIAAAIPVAEKRGIRVQGRVPNPAATIEASLAELSRVLRNLVANAIRESADGGTVQVEAVVEDGWGILSVQDSCGGIPPAVMERVFEASYRGESARTPRSDGGAGLGLAIARGFVEAHGGDISVANTEDGCRFVARVPARRPETSARAGRSVPLPYAAGAGMPTQPGLPVEEGLPPLPLGDPAG